MSYVDIAYAVDGAVATITLNRPDALNAWTRTMEQEVHAAMTEASADDAVRAIILTGAGRGFCAGADMNLLSGIQEGAGAGARTSDSVRAFDNGIDGGLSLPADYGMRYTYFPTVPKPIIAAINGPAAGLGLIMALYCDMRFASDAAVFTTAFSRRGLIAEHGISWILPKLVGHANALDLLLSARKIGAPEAAEMGLVKQGLPHGQLRGRGSRLCRRNGDHGLATLDPGDEAAGLRRPAAAARARRAGGQLGDASEFRLRGLQGRRRPFRREAGAAVFRALTALEASFEKGRSSSSGGRSPTRGALLRMR